MLPRLIGKMTLAQASLELLLARVHQLPKQFIASPLTVLWVRERCHRTACCIGFVPIIGPKNKLRMGCLVRGRGIEPRYQSFNAATDPDWALPISEPRQVILHIICLRAIEIT